MLGNWFAGIDIARTYKLYKPYKLIYKVHNAKKKYPFGLYFFQIALYNFDLNQ
jgi:hypothetical protein